MKKLLYIIYFLAALILIVLVLQYIRTTVSNEIGEIPGLEKNNDTHISPKPQRIVSLAPNITEILFALGLGDKVVAVSDNCDYPPQVLDKPKIGAFFAPSVEAIVSHKPDLVITLWFAEQKNVADSLSRIGIKTVTIKLEKIDELTAAIEKIGKETNTSNKAEELVKNINNEIGKISQKYKDDKKPKVLWLVQNEPVRAAGSKTFINEIIELAGGQNAVRQTAMQYPQLGSENILSCGAEVIIHSAMNKDDMEKEKADAEQIWQKFPQLPAVKQNRIYVIDPDTTLRLGPRLPKGIAMIASLIHSGEKTK